jgi:hypothetical protein
LLRAGRKGVEPFREREREREGTSTTKMSPSDLTNPSPQLGVVLQWHKAATAWEFDVLEVLLSDDYTYKILPASANEQPKNKGEAMAYAKSVGASVINL